MVTCIRLLDITVKMCLCYNNLKVINYHSTILPHELIKYIVYLSHNFVHTCTESCVNTVNRNYSAILATLQITSYALGV